MLFPPPSPPDVRLEPVCEGTGLARRCVMLIDGRWTRVDPPSPPLNDGYSVVTAIMVLVGFAATSMMVRLLRGSGRRMRRTAF